MKKRLFSKRNGITVALAFALSISNSSYSQTPTLIAPSATSNIYPGGTGVPPTSCFTFGNVLFNGNPYDPYISAWGDLVVWRIAAPGSAVAFPWQGSFTIAGASEVKVCMINTGTPYICAVYRLGSSFYLSLYIWNSTSFVPWSTTLITNAAGSRISMDVYALGMVGIVWDEIQPVTFQPVLKCKFSAVGSTTFTGNYTLAGTTGQTHPDIAMTRTAMPSPSYLNGNSVHAHIAALTGPPGARVITEYAIPVEDIILTNPAIPFSPTIEDVNNLGNVELNPIPFIDCPDFDDNMYANWAYAYVNDGNICGRFSDFSSGTILTSVFTDGSMGNVPITLSGGLYYANFDPTITYDNTGATIFVGWRHSMYPAPQSIAGCVQVNKDGTTLVSPMDYLLINTSQASSAPVFSKHTRTASFLYANTLEFSTSRTHYFHDWSSTNFKPGLGAGNPVLSDNRISIYPNPVTDHIKVNIPAALAHQTLTLVITDALGKVIHSSSVKSEQLAPELSKALEGKASGTYLLNIHEKNTGYSQEEKLVKLH